MASSRHVPRLRVPTTCVTGSTHPTPTPPEAMVGQVNPRGEQPQDDLAEVHAILPASIHRRQQF
jgi:hypothetical protein